MDKDKFVQTVKFYCEKKGVKPTNACRDSGAGKSLIDQLERRGSIPSVEKVQLLAQYLGVTTSELLGEAEAGDSIDRDLSPEEHRLLEAYARADQRARDMVDLALAPFAKKKTVGRTG